MGGLMPVINRKVAPGPQLVPGGEELAVAELSLHDGWPSRSSCVENMRGVAAPLLLKTEGG